MLAKSPFSAAMRAGERTIEYLKCSSFRLFYNRLATRTLKEEQSKYVSMPSVRG